MKDKIFELIGIGDFDTVFKLLNEVALKCQNSDLSDKIQIIKIRYNNNIKNRQLGVINYDQYSLDNNRIILDIIEMLSNLQSFSNLTDSSSESNSIKINETLIDAEKWIYLILLQLYTSNNIPDCFWFLAIRQPKFTLFIEDLNSGNINYDNLEEDLYYYGVGLSKGVGLPSKEVLKEMEDEYGFDPLANGEIKQANKREGGGGSIYLTINLNIARSFI